MKFKRILYLMLIITVMVVVAACGAKKPTPKEAAEVLVNTMIYQKDEDIKKYESVFNKDATQLKEGAENLFKAGFSTSPDLGFSDKEVTDLWNMILKQMNDKATYTVEVVKNDKTNPEIIIKIKGIRMTSITTTNQSEIKEAVQKDPTIAQDKAKRTKLLISVMKDAIKNIEASDTEVTIPVKLEPNKDSKNKWQIVDEIQTTSKIATAFLLGQ
ncbi:DUF5105 domain-containing protein [Metaclostridioides mangenotii]|uniref:DUF5105 domain-containing protein n=1 Tax=Metaclostridioides mangenotii TaxID=1540 RepID=UPI000462F99A|nr:DUF5105 domain-containing protein [Clostridioides mangenotii]